MGMGGDAESGHYRYPAAGFRRGSCHTRGRSSRILGKSLPLYSAFVRTNAKKQACGVTPQVAVESAGDKIDGLVFAHEPGNMLLTDLTGAM